MILVSRPSNDNLFANRAVLDPPEVTLPVHRIVLRQTLEVVLECVVNAFPMGVFYWQRGRQRVTAKTDRCRLEALEESESSLTLRLTIADLRPADYGIYTCVAWNKLGRREDSLALLGGYS